MKQKRNVHFTYNPFFLIPFFIWIILGSLVQFFFDKQQLFSLVNSHYTNTLDIIMSFITTWGEGSFIIPVLLLLWLYKKEHRHTVFLWTILLANIGAFLFSQAIKNIINAPRPLNYFHEATWIHILPNWAHYYHNSFPSGHTTGAFALFSFVSFLLKGKYRVFGLLFFLMALTVAYSRLYLAAHFFMDVYTGSIVGTVFSTLAFTIFFKRNHTPSAKAS